MRSGIERFSGSRKVLFRNISTYRTPSRFLWSLRTKKAYFFFPSKILRRDLCFFLVFWKTTRIGEIAIGPSRFAAIVHKRDLLTVLVSDARESKRPSFVVMTSRTCGNFESVNPCDFYFAVKGTPGDKPCESRCSKLLQSVTVVTAMTFPHRHSPFIYLGTAVPRVLAASSNPWSIFDRVEVLTGLSGFFLFLSLFLLNVKLIFFSAVSYCLKWFR